MGRVLGSREPAVWMTLRGLLPVWIHLFLLCEAILINTIVGRTALCYMTPRRLFSHSVNGNSETVTCFPDPLGTSPWRCGGAASGRVIEGCIQSNRLQGQ
jgi:hypothetical protein